MAIPTFVWTPIRTTGGTLARDEEEDQSWILPSSSLRTQARSYRLFFSQNISEGRNFPFPSRKSQNTEAILQKWLHIIVIIMSAKFSLKCHCLKPATQPVGQAAVAAGWGRVQLPYVTWARAAAEQGTRASSHALEIPSWLRWEFSVADLMLRPECSQDSVPSPECNTLSIGSGKLAEACSTWQPNAMLQNWLAITSTAQPILLAKEKSLANAAKYWVPVLSWAPSKR